MTAALSRVANIAPKVGRQRVGRLRVAVKLVANNAMSIVLNRALSEVEPATTLAHELAHHLLHREDDAGVSTKATRETEAEGVSFAAFGYFGFDTSRFTFAYVARYAKEPEFSKRR